MSTGYGIQVAAAEGTGSAGGNVATSTPTGAAMPMKTAGPAMALGAAVMGVVVAL